MVAIRLSRTGAKKRPSYRVVVIDSRRARDSRNIEIVGHYNPRPDPIEVVLKRDRIDYWVSVGAQLSDTVKRLVRHFDERVADEAKNGAPAPEPAAAVEAPEEVVEEAAAPEASAPGAPGPVAPGEEVDEDSDVVEALLELEGAAGSSEEAAVEEEPFAVAGASEIAVAEAAGDLSPESPEAASAEPVAVGEADSATAPEPEAAAEAAPEAALEPEAAAEGESEAAPEPAAAAEAEPAAVPEPEADEPGEPIAEGADSGSQPAEAKPE